jgi:rSAM/selenodomain-associated transferase 2
MPALDEEQALPLVLADLAGLASLSIDEIVVVDNGSRDETAALARAAGATVLLERRRGYGNACLRGLDHLRASSPALEVVVFLDADRSDFAEDLPHLLRPLLAGEADLVIGTRHGSHAVPLHARMGNWLATHLIAVLFGYRYTDLGPFRAVRFSALEGLGMTDRAFGWTVEMQVRALQRGVRVAEVPVRYRARVGRSKISGTLRGTLRAGTAIMGTIVRLWWSGPTHRTRRRSPSTPPPPGDGTPWLTMIVPTLNEASRVMGVLEDVAGTGVQTVVVDGGSHDATASLARRYADAVIVTPPGRAIQMNAGAAAARGDTLLFVHADTRLPAGFAEDIAGALADPDVIGGRFDVRLDAPGVVYALIGRLVSLRSRLTRVATGDQAIFVRREVFERVGGYPAVPLMEDIALSRAMKRAGRVACLRSSVTTSARRWQRYGPLRTIVLMWALRFLYYCGVSPHTLRRAYPDCD